VVATYAANKDVSFGDVNLSENEVGRGPPHNPGSGGWPTIRYFNTETGLAGGSYVQKNKGQAICDELGKEENMAAYVEEYGKTALCDALSPEFAGCSDREINYIKKIKASGLQEQISQLNRLNSLAGESMKPDLSIWVNARKKILQQLVISQQQSAEL